MLLIRGILGVMMQVTGLAVFLLIPAGTWHWPRALAVVTGHAVILLTAVVFLARYAPRSLEARMQKPLDSEQPVADRIITILMSLALISWIAFIPIDVFRLHLLPTPPAWLSAVGGLASVTGLLIVVTALYQNAFAAPIVKIQSDRGQTVVDSGLYGHIRHPFYAGMFTYLIGLGLWLQSYASLFMLLVWIAGLVARIRVEERTLCDRLKNYPDYMKRVPYRIIPGIW